MQGFKLEKIWDPVTRLWHWVLAILVAVGWSFGKFMSFDTVQWHMYIGYCILGLMAFRLLWGFVGPEPIRWRRLLPTPQATLHYLKTVTRRNPSGTPGHNPLGSLSVLALVVAISAQALTGLFIESEDFFESGPLAYLLSQDMIYRLTGWHHLLADVVLVLVVLHVGAILFYLVWKRENLIKPMITGWKWIENRDSDPP